MAIYNGVYRWDGTRTSGQDPIAWSAGAYDVKIYRRNISGTNVEMLKPYVCIYSRTGKGHSISANPERFVKQLCLEFSLELERVLWVEDHLSGENRYEIVMFSRFSKMGNTMFYKVEKRDPLDHEVAQLKREIETIS